LLARVARQRPQSPTTSPTVETTSTAATSRINRAFGSSGIGTRLVTDPGKGRRSKT
jgi:hypothetical protein